MFSNFARFAHAHLWLIGLAALGVGQSRSQGPRSFWSATGIGPHCPCRWTKQRGLWERDWALAKNNNTIDRKWNCSSLCFALKFRNYLDLFSTLIGQTKYHFGKEIRKNSHHGSRSPKYAELWQFHVVVLQRTAAKCTKIYEARAQPLHCRAELFKAGLR